MSIEKRSSILTQQAARAFTRRTLLRSAAAVGAVAATGPFIGGRAFGQSSGQLDLFTWGDYVTQEMVDKFQNDTGIRLNLSTYGTNAEVLNRMRAAGGEGFDIIMPSITEVEGYLEYDLLRPMDENEIDDDAIIPSMWESSRGLGGERDGQRFAVPFNWGTEGITLDTEAVEPTYGEISYGSLWNPDYAGRVTLRSHSGMIGMGLMLDYTGEVPSNRMRDTYVDEDKMRAVYDRILEHAVAQADKINMFWNNAQETEAAFLQNGCVIGQTWDGPGMRLRSSSNGRYTYLAPKEGALTWMDSMAMPQGARNIEQAYAWINWIYRPENAALHVIATGYNSTVAGTDAHAGEEYAANFAAAYPGDALDNLWWYPSVPVWFSALQSEYRERFIASL